MSELLLAAMGFVLVLVGVAGLMMTSIIEKRIDVLKDRVDQLAKQSEDQATLINEQSQLILRITGELRRSR